MARPIEKTSAFWRRRRARAAARPELKILTPDDVSICAKPHVFGVEEMGGVELIGPSRAPDARCAPSSDSGRIVVVNRAGCSIRAEPCGPAVWKLSWVVNDDPEGPGSPQQRDGVFSPQPEAGAAEFAELDGDRQAAGLVPDPSESLPGEKFE